MAREVAATAEVDARTKASQMVREFGRRKAEEIAWEYSDRCKANEDKLRYEAWQAVIRNITDRTEHPPIASEVRASFGHGGPALPKLVADERVPVGTAEFRDAKTGKLLGKITDIGDG